MSAANTVRESTLRKERDDLGKEIRDLRVENGELRGCTDVAIALMPVIEWTTVHEKRAAERHEATIVVLDLIAQRLGPDPDGGNGS